MLDRTTSLVNGHARPTPRKLWSYAGSGEWRRVSHPIGQTWEGSQEEIEAQAEAAGWFRLGTLGHEHGTFSLDVWEAEKQRDLFFCVVWILDKGLEIVLPDVPALWRLLAEAGPLLAEGRASMKD